MQARIALTTLVVLIVSTTLNAVAKDDSPTHVKGDATKISLAALFSYHVVLQRDMPTKIWGWSNVGGRVVVSLGGNSSSAVADAKGEWVVTLSAMSAGGPYEFVVRGAETIAVKDVLIGEVWVCSGQSNMSYSMSRFRNCAEDVPQMKYRMIHPLIPYTIRGGHLVPGRTEYKQALSVRQAVPGHDPGLA